MELEGLKRCRKYLEDKKLTVAELTTDRHTGVINYLHKEWPEVRHYFDTWHVAKSKLLRIFFFRCIQLLGNLVYSDWDSNTRVFFVFAFSRHAG